MKKTFFTLLGCLILTYSLPAQTQRLVDPAWVQERMGKDDLVILHLGMQKKFDAEHIEGAIFMNYSEFTYDNKEEGIVFDLVADEQLKKSLESKGISNRTDVVIYTPKNMVPLVTRFYFTMDYIGHGAKTYILDGGLMEWKAHKGAISTDTPTPSQATFNIKPNTSLLADQKIMLASIKDSEIDIIDCRAEVYYNGIEPTRGARNGRMPTAKTIPYTSLYQESDNGAYKFKSLDEIAAIFESQGLKKDRNIVLYCHIGLQLTVIYTAAQMLGYENIKIYDGSFHEWGPDEALPIEVD